MTRTTENTIPTMVATKRSELWNRLREASVRVSDIRLLLHRRWSHDRSPGPRTGEKRKECPRARADGPARRQRAGEDDGALGDGGKGDRQQRILQPDYGDIMQQINTVGI